jgi:hypothetical protein
VITLFFLEAFEFFVIALVILGFVSQIVIPIFRGENMFPLFNRRLRRAKQRITDATTEQDVVLAEKKAREAEKAARQLRREKP